MEISYCNFPKAIAAMSDDSNQFRQILAVPQAGASALPLSTSGKNRGEAPGGNKVTGISLKERVPMAPGGACCDGLCEKGPEFIPRSIIWNTQGGKTVSFVQTLEKRPPLSAVTIIPPPYSPSRNWKSSSVSARVKLSSPRMSAARALLLRWRVRIFSSMLSFTSSR